MNLLLMNLGMDAKHTALGFTTAWTNALARRCDHITVISMFKGDLAVDSNVAVYSLGKERGWSEPRRLREFYRLVRRALSEHPIDACFAHNTPLFASLFAPVAKKERIPILLWYAHGAISVKLRVAHALVDRCVTSTSSGFRLKSNKLYIVGQGIDTKVFRPPEDVPPSYGTTALSIGRITQSKRIDEMLSAVALLRRRDVALKLEIIGEPLTAADVKYADAMQRQVEALDLRDSVVFTGAVSFDRIAERYRQGTLFVNTSETRSMDKAILESMASGCVPISRNESFRALASAEGLDALIPAHGAEGLAECLSVALTMDASARQGLSAKLRRIVETQHSLDALCDKLMSHLVELVGQPPAVISDRDPAALLPERPRP